MFSVILKQIETTLNPLRTSKVIGLAPELPKVGRSFFMYAEGLEEGVRHVYTSMVTEVKEVDGEVVFKTQNSLYSLKKLSNCGSDYV
jgi:hypothetical protein